MIDRVGVVVPARDEAARLPSCLDALAAAAAHVRVPVRVVVVLDRCTDASESVVRAAAGRHRRLMSVETVLCTAGMVGAARARGVEHLTSGERRSDVWLATTDADSLVPASWLRRQLARAADGALMVAGTVTVTDWLTWPDPTRIAYDAAYSRWLRPDGHGHVHGANLGIRADLYRELGGFASVAFDEDVGLVEAALAREVAVSWATDIAVTTSARPVSRTPHGFSTHLAEQHLAELARAESALMDGASPALRMPVGRTR